MKITKILFHNFFWIGLTFDINYAILYMIL